MFHQEFSRKSITYSAFIHVAAFSFLAFSFGAKLPGAASYGSISFWSDIPIPSYYQSSANPLGNIKTINDFFRKPQDILKLERAKSKSLEVSPGYIKPQLLYNPGYTKVVFKQKAAPDIFVRKSTEPNIVFHPVLPYGFNIYFKDRQVAHVEAAFKIMPTRTGNTITIKRKISSGNPEVDLLTMRYMSHYLFIQQNRFPSDIWQTVRIDLSENK